MTVPILFLYMVGIIFFIFGIEEDGNNSITRNIIYLGMSFFVNLLGYYSSYSDTDYVSLAYLPLAIIALSILVLIYNVWELIPVPKSWDTEADSDDD